MMGTFAAAAPGSEHRGPKLRPQPRSKCHNVSLAPRFFSSSSSSPLLPSWTPLFSRPLEDVPGTV